MKLRLNAIQCMPWLRYSLKNMFDQVNDVLFNSALPVADQEIRYTT